MSWEMRSTLFSVAKRQTTGALHQIHLLAIENFRLAIRIKSDFVAANWNLSQCLLLIGDLRNGWKKYEYRKRETADNKCNRRVVSVPYKKWTGESLWDKVILVTAEQGVGDEVMFASCIPN